MVGGVVRIILDNVSSLEVAQFVSHHQELRLWKDGLVGSKIPAANCPSAAVSPLLSTLFIAMHKNAKIHPLCWVEKTDNDDDCDDIGWTVDK